MDTKKATRRIRIEPGVLQSSIPCDATMRVDRVSHEVLAVKHSPHGEWTKPAIRVEASQDSFICTSSLSNKLRKRKDRSSRFKMVDKLGEGAAGVVYALHDANCDREVAIKVLRDDIGKSPMDVEKFICEARVVANLEHPNIIPIYDLDVDENGQVYLAMRKICGHTLESYIDDAEEGDEHPEIKNHNDLVRVFLKVCDALAYAHSVGRIHQDVKPQNIMMGRFGQVFLIDWGASVFDGEEIAVTPVYMSPQQADGETAAPGDDIYCLGATLFHCLTLRYPTNAETLGELWKKKVMGQIEEPTDEERSKAPGPLMAIALKALEPLPEDRYHAIEDMASDLMNYQAGLSVSAHQDSVMDYVRRKYRQHKQMVWSAACVALILLSSALFITQQKLKERADWGEPVHVEHFQDGGWRERWAVVSGKFANEDGRLVTRGDRMHMLLLRQKLEGHTAIEFEGEMLPGSPECDVSLVWFQDVQWADDGMKVKKMEKPIWLQVGAWGNSFARIKEDATLDFKQFRLRHGRRYKIRVEIEERELSIFVDGDRICHHKRVFPVSSGYICLYGYFEGKAFDDVTIYSKRVAEKVSVTQIPDTFFLDGHYRDAIRHYDQIVRSHGDKHLGREAAYKTGLCHMMLGEKTKAYDIWGKLRKTDLSAEVEPHFLRRLFDAGRHNYVITDMERLYRDGNSALRKRLRLQWGYFFGKVNDEESDGVTNAYIELRNKHFPDETAHHHELASFYLKQADYQRVLTEYPGQRWACAQALLLLRQYEKLVKDYPEQRGSASLALIRLGRTGEALRDYPEQRRGILKELRQLKRWEDVMTYYGDKPKIVIEALAAMGRFREMLVRYPDNERARARALLGLERYEELLKTCPRAALERADAELRLGRFEEVMAKYPNTHRAFLAARRLGKVRQFLKLPVSGKLRYEAMMHLGEFEQVLQVFATNDHYCVGAHGHRGEFDEILRHRKGTIWGPPWALGMQGRWDEAVKQYPDEVWARISQLQRRGENERVLKEYPEHRKHCAESLIYLGRYEDVINRYPEQRDLVAAALLYLGRESQVLQLYQDFHGRCIEASYLGALKERVKSGKGELRVPKYLTDSYVGYATGGMFAHFLLPGMVDLISGRRSEFDWRYMHHVRSSRHCFNQRLWHQAAFVVGKVGEDQFRQQPHRMLVESELLLAKAMRAECAAESLHALEYYQLYAKEPAFRKRIDPVVDCFVQWRISELSTQTTASRALSP